ncbi:MAG: choice-of-anchor D domain-containing protein [Verrucomicrobiota bacterium]
MTLNQRSSLSQNITVTRQTENTTSGLPDSWWIQYFGSTANASSTADSDGDGLSNADEYALGSSPTNPNDPASKIAIEDSTGASISSNTTVVYIGSTLVGGSPVSASFSIRNLGSGFLRNLSLTKNGTHSSDFTAGPLVLSSIQPGGNTTLTVSLAPSSGGNRTARVVIPSNDPDANPFVILLSGFGIGTNLDSDGDGLNDAAEYSMSNLGFDWRTSQPALVGTLSENVNKAGYFGEGQIQDLNVGMPLLSKNSTSGKFKLTLSLEKSTNLGQGFAPMPFEESGTFLTNDGKLEFEFTSPGNAAFFRLKAK